MSVCYVILWDTLFYFAFTKSLTLRKALRLGIPLLVLSLIMPVLDIENAQIAFVALGSGLIALLWTRHLGSKAILIFFESAICVVAAIYADDYFRPSKLMMDPEFADYLQAKRVPLRNAILYYLFIVSFYDWAALNIAQLFLVRASKADKWLEILSYSFAAALVALFVCTIAVFTAAAITKASPATFLEYGRVLREHGPEGLFQDPNAAKTVSIYVMSFTVMIPPLAFFLLIIFGFITRLLSPVARFLGTWMQELLSQEGGLGRGAAGVIIQLTFSTVLIFSLVVVLFTR